jgi:hypothetical protein
LKGRRHGHVLDQQVICFRNRFDESGQRFPYVEEVEAMLP